MDTDPQALKNHSWSVFEKLLLAQAVFRWGGDDWATIAQAMRGHPMVKRPDVFTQQTCSQKYANLLEELERSEAEKKNKKKKQLLKILLSKLHAGCTGSELQNSKKQLRKMKSNFVNWLLKLTRYVRASGMIACAKS
ncbi:uncharacterized protein VTP21DRAFT_7065 [Calcarisporiella thermophila]|uniref:uncharacterized protein n=1 Tax=Calcarisporiella thermophila TaxID=911321 RepID=UPI003742CF3C